MDRITRFSLRNDTVILLAALMVTFGGWYVSGQMEKETMPDVSIPIVAVVTPYPGAAPADVYDDVTQPLERALAGVQGLESLSGTSRDSVSVVVGEFGYSQDMDEAEDEMLKAMETAELPDNALEPDVVRISFGSQPILKLAVAGGGSTAWLRDTVRDEVVPSLEALEGVGEVSMSSDDPTSVRVVFVPEELEDRGLTAEDVVQQLQASNISFPVGAVTVGSAEEPIRVSGTLETIEDIEDLRIAIYPDMREIYGESLGQMGEGMGALGGAVGQIGEGMGELGAGVGELGGAVGELGTGMGELGEGLGVQIGLVSALQSTQADLLDAKIALNGANAVLLDPTATPAEIAAAQATIAEMSATIPALEGAVAGIEAELAAVQEAAMAATPTAIPEMPGAPSSGAAMPGLSPGSVVLEEPRPTIGLVTLGELADVFPDDGLGPTFSRLDGEPAVLIDVTKTQDGNTVAVSELVQEKLEELEAELAGDLDLTLTYDAADYINRSIWDMVREGLMGAVIAFFVMLVFLRNWRSTLIAAISIPLSVVAALLVIAQFNVTLNVMTLGGITVAIGRIVDDSIVVIENTYRHLQIGDERTPELMRIATREVSSAITSSTLTTVAVFAPMALVSGIVGKVFTPFALTVAAALLSSLLVSVTVVPLLAKWTLMKAAVPPRDEAQEKASSYYARLLAWSLEHKKPVMATAALMFVGSLALIPVIGLGFMPPSTENYANVDVEYPSGTTAETVDGTLVEVEEAVAGMGDVEFYQASVGAASGFNVGVGANRGTVFTKFGDEADMDARMQDLRDQVAPLAGEDAVITVAQSDVSGAGANTIEIILTGSDFGDVTTAAERVAEAVVAVDGLENVSSNVSEERPQIAVDVDQAAAAEHGLNAAMVAGAIRGYIADEDAGTVDLETGAADITYSTGLDGIASAHDVAAIELAAPLGGTVKVGNVAHVQEVGTPVAVLTLDEREYAAVTGVITERDSSTVIADIEHAIAEANLPEGVHVEISGVAEMMAESFEQLGLAMVIAVFAVYIVMVVAFGESVAPLTIMVSLPLAIIGGILGLFLWGLPLDMPAMIGALMLIGIVTTNAIVLIDRVSQKLAEKKPRRDALLEAGSERIRPILMTALTTIGALLPMALGVAEGALMSQSLAVIVVGGLTTSTALTLIVVPVVYDWLEGWKHRLLGERAERFEFAE